MPPDQHHKSKKVRYDLLLVPRDDAGQSRSIRFAPWQFYSLIGGSVVVMVAIVLLILIFTPIGGFVPIENPGLVNRYGKELISLNQRMTSLMEELVELREYNVTLRRALGEKVTVADSNFVLRGAPLTSRVDTRAQDERLLKGEGETAARPARQLFHSVSMQPAELETNQIVFPVVMPTTGYVTRGYDPDQRHYGLDIAGKIGTPVCAATDGHVVFAGWTIDGGYKVIMSHVGGFLTFYEHNQALLTAVGAFVKRGEPIALLGNTGETSLGPHVHFEIWKDGVPVDPANYILNLNL
jgi:murein DD-endopeptidase MepM/ murein hydrolase activator NlpD